MDVMETRLFIRDPRGHEGERENGRSSAVALNDGPTRGKEKEEATRGNR